MKKIPAGMMSYYEAECRKQKDGSHQQASLSLADDSSITTSLRHLTDCVKQNLTGEWVDNADEAR